jgi:hypothetical protein
MQYYYEVVHASASMNDALEFLRARFEGERNALAERVSLARTLQQPNQSLLDYASEIRLKACYCGFPDSYANQALLMFLLLV